MIQGSENPIRLFTVDLNTSNCAEVDDQILNLTIKEKRKIIEDERRKLWEHKFKRVGLSSYRIISEDPDWKEMRDSHNPVFSKLFEQALRKYLAGSWNRSLILFDELLEMSPNDGPSKALRNFMQIENRGVCPSDCPGYRSIIEK